VVLPFFEFHLSLPQISHLGNTTPRAACQQKEKDMFKSKKKKEQLQEIKLNHRWFLDIHGLPYTLFDRFGMILNNQPQPLGYSCKHRTSGGFCDECWDVFIMAGLKELRR